MTIAMSAEEYLVKINSLIEQSGFTAIIVNQEEKLILDTRDLKTSIDPKIHVLDNRQLTGYEEVWRLILNAFIKTSSGVSEIIDKNYLKLVGGPKEWDLIYEFVVSFVDLENRTTFKQVIFNIPLGIVASVGGNSPKLLGLIQKIFCAKYDNIYSPNILKANDSCYIKKELKTQLIAELMEELEKEIE
jgi:hypothetical protein